MPKLVGVCTVRNGEPTPTPKPHAVPRGQVGLVIEADETVSKFEPRGKASDTSSLSSQGQKETPRRSPRQQWAGHHRPETPPPAWAAAPWAPWPSQYEKPGREYEQHNTWGSWGSWTPARAAPAPQALRGPKLAGMTRQQRLRHQQRLLEEAPH